jgi:hypothetical protein
MTKEILKTKSKEEIFDFIRETLSFKDILTHLRYVDADTFKKEHKRFEMSGYGDDCTSFNTSILNEFEYLGIYDYTHYLVLDFYKGMGTLYLKYWGDAENLEVEVNNLGTVEIIFTVFQKTIFSERQTRRRI